MGKLIQKKLQAGTLVEVLVALIIIMAVFTIASQIYTNMMVSTPDKKRVEARHVIGILLDRVATDNNFEPGDIQLDSIQYHVNIETYEAAPGLLRVEITAFRNGSELAKGRRLMAKP